MNQPHVIRFPLVLAALTAHSALPGTPLVTDAYTPDPAPVADGDTLWVFTGHDLGGNGFNMPDWQVLSTQDLRTWTNHGPVLKTEVFAWARQGNDAWASQAVKRDGKWYWYVAAGDAQAGLHGIGVATADSPLGPWTDPIGKPLVPGGWGHIDPSVMIDDDGTAWLFWGNNGCWYAPLRRNMVELDVAAVDRIAAEHPELRRVGDWFEVRGLFDEAAFGPHKLRDGKPATNFEEAPWIYRVGDTYYLEYAAGGVPEHWAYSTAKSIHGPWTYRGKILGEAEKSFTIHGGSVRFKGQWYIVYHDGTAPGGGGFARSAGILPYVRGADGSIPYVEVPRYVRAYACEGPAGGLGLQYRREGSERWEYANGRNWCFTQSNLGGWGDKKLMDPVLYHDEQRGVWHLFYHDGSAERRLCHTTSWGPHNLRDWGRQNWVESDAEKAMYAKALAAKGEWPLGESEFRSFGRSEWKEYCPWHMTLDRTCDDTNRYARLAGKVRVSLALDATKRPYAISQQQLGIFFEDISGSHEVFVGPGPGTFRGHGWRTDVARAIQALKPKFMRFPGGCIVHGSDLANTYRWKDTVGPLPERKPKPNLWGGMQDYRLGFYEYFQFCEDIGMEPLPVVSAGVTCPNPQRMMGDAELAEWVQDVLDLIDFANGDPAQSKWAKLRAYMGHPKPFRLKMLGVGNEDDVNDYFERGFRRIVAAVKAKDPKMEIVGTAGPMVGTRDYAEGWKLAKRMRLEYVDEHYYVSPGWIYGNQRMYEDYDRNGPKVYAGEYASHKEGRVNDMETALSCAVLLCNYEKNGDVVAMASYAPLFAKRGQERWRPNLIYFTDDAVELTTDYWTQYLFGNYAGERYVPNALEVGGVDGVLGSRDDEQRFRNRFAASVVTRGKRTVVKLVNTTVYDVALELPPLGRLTAMAVFRDGKVRQAKGGSVPGQLTAETMLVLEFAQ
ncbi:MAG: family 43 glycosylhydrolase [Kiritimatiellia bacterium]